MELVNLTLSRGVLDLPHPLLADNVDFRCECRSLHLFEVNVCTPNEKAHGDHQRNDCPDRFEPMRACYGSRYFKRRSPAITDYKENKHAGNQQRKERRHARQVEVQCIDLTGERRSGFREPGYPATIHLPKQRLPLVNERERSCACASAKTSNQYRST